MNWPVWTSTHSKSVHSPRVRSGRRTSNFCSISTSHLKRRQLLLLSVIRSTVITNPKHSLSFGLALFMSVWLDKKFEHTYHRRHLTVPCPTTWTVPTNNSYIPKSTHFLILNLVELEATFIYSQCFFSVASNVVQFPSRVRRSLLEKRSLPILLAPHLSTSITNLRLRMSAWNLFASKTTS